MNISAILLTIETPLSGNSINGKWSKQNIIVETTGSYPKKVCFSIWNGRVDISELEIGKEYIFHCNIESKEYKGKWYTEVTLWKIDEADLFEDEDDFFQIPELTEDLDKALDKALEENKNREHQDTPKKSFREQLEEFGANEKNQPAKIAGIEAKRPSDQKTENTGETRVDPNVPPGLEEMFLKYFNEDATFTGEVTEISDVEADPDEENIIMSGNASNMPDRFKINVDEVALPSEKVPIDDVSFTDKNSTENNTGNIKPHGKLKIDLKKLKSTRKLRGKNDLNDPDFSL